MRSMVEGASASAAVGVRARAFARMRDKRRRSGASTIRRQAEGARKSPPSLRRAGFSATADRVPRPRQKRKPASFWPAGRTSEWS